MAMIQTSFKSTSTSQRGFSAVELLITLFIGFLFIMMGYQLYSTIIASSGESRQRATANNIAYAELRKYAGKSGDYANSQISCSNPTAAYNLNPVPKVPSVSSVAEMTVNICTPDNIPTLRRVTVTIDLKTSTDPKLNQEIVHALFVEA